MESMQTEAEVDADDESIEAAEAAAVAKLRGESKPINQSMLS